MYITRSSVKTIYLSLNNRHIVMSCHKTAKASLKSFLSFKVKVMLNNCLHSLILLFILIDYWSFSNEACIIYDERVLECPEKIIKGSYNPSSAKLFLFNFKVPMSRQRA